VGKCEFAEELPALQGIFRLKTVAILIFSFFLLLFLMHVFGCSLQRCLIWLLIKHLTHTLAYTFVVLDFLTFILFYLLNLLTFKSGMNIN